MKNTLNKNQDGSVLLVVLSSVFGIIALILAGVSIWLYGEMNKAQSDVDSKVNLRVSEAEDKFNEKCEEKMSRERLRTVSKFNGPADLGSVSFDYPRDWSVYVDTDTTRNYNKYEAYFYPKEVPKVSSSQQFSLRLTIENKDYDSVMNSYQSKIKKGDLASSSENSQGHEGTRLSGEFSKDIRGYAVVYKLRDKTLTLRTDAEDFKQAFDQVAKTIDFED